MSELMIYGASGYTGALTARRARAAGLAPVLAGRSAAALAPLAAELDLPVRVFSLDAAEPALAGVTAVLNAAGPFDTTAPPLMAACLRSSTHYLDLAGEVPAVEAAVALDERARAAGVLLLPGAGFGVVATDLLAAHVAVAVADVREVVIAFHTAVGVSRGTAEVLLPDLRRPGIRRVDGEAVSARPGERVLQVDFGDGRLRRAVLNPWRADLVTAAHSTGAATVTTYQTLPAPLPLLMRAGRPLGPVLDSRAWERLVRRLPAGPDERSLAAGSVRAWASARGADGTTASAVLSGPEAYEFTARAASALLARAGRGDAPAGFRTPVTAYGTGLLADLDGVVLGEVRATAPA